MKVVIIIVIVLVVLALIGIGAVMFFMSSGVNFEEVKDLVEPRITSMPDQKVIEIEAKGDPNESAGEAIGMLMKTYYKIDGVEKGFVMPAPKARWDSDFAASKSEWIGRFALQVPDNVESLPEIESEGGVKAELSTWEYGEVAEILHVGPYDTEHETIQKLLGFIENSGYEIVGMHEEEYLKGPGMFGKGNPEKYLTIIRYNVAEKPAEETPVDSLSSDTTETI